MCEAQKLGMSPGNCDVRDCKGGFCEKFKINLSEVKAANRRRHAFDRDQSGELIVENFYERVKAATRMRGG